MRGTGSGGSFFDRLYLWDRPKFIAERRAIAWGKNSKNLQSDAFDKFVADEVDSFLDWFSTGAIQVGKDVSIHWSILYIHNTQCIYLRGWGIIHMCRRTNRNNNAHV
jgi:hypothetical protein